MTFRCAPLLPALLLLATAACSSSGSGGSGGGSTSTSNSSAADSSSSAGGAGGAGGSASATGAGGAGGAGGAAIDCSGATGSKFPTFDSSCQIDGDCALEFHQVSCCGTRVAVGVAVSASAAFAVAETSCEKMYPGCGCAQEPTKADDGKTGDEKLIKVQCKTGGCYTFFP
jgi:hypothetical protein